MFSLRTLFLAELLLWTVFSAVCSMSPEPTSLPVPPPKFLGTATFSSPTFTINHSFEENLSQLRISTAAVADELRNFNTLYIGKLESRMVSMAESLGSLHSNMGHLLERAHIWDTLQHHLTSWTEQMHTLSSKMDLLNRAQETLLALESKLSSLPTMDYRLQAITARMDDIETKLDTVTHRLLDSQWDSGLVGHFSTRGALATLKVLERKLDRVTQQLNKVARRTGGSGEQFATITSNGPNKSMIVKCQTSPTVLDILRDMSAKIDVIFDSNESSRHESLGTRDRQEDGEERTVELEQIRQRTIIERETTFAESDQIRYETTTAETSMTESSGLTESVMSVTADTSSVEDSTLQLLPTATYISNENDSVSRTTVRPTTLNQHAPSANNNLTIECNGGKIASALKSLSEEVRRLRSQRSLTPLSSADDNNEEPKSCDTLRCGADSGVYGFKDLPKVYCHVEGDGNGWTVIMSRTGDFDQTAINRTWDEYKDGIGSPFPSSNFYWIGNKWLHHLTSKAEMELRVLMRNPHFTTNNQPLVDYYDSFRVGPEEQNFVLFVGGHSGNGSSVLTPCNGDVFTTPDRMGMAPHIHSPIFIRAHPFAKKYGFWRFPHHDEPTMLWNPNAQVMMLMRNKNSSRSCLNGRETWPIEK